MTFDDLDHHRLRDLLDASFGHGPAQPAPEARLEAGRRRLRLRRRLAAAGSAAAVASVLVGVGVALAGPGAVAPQGADPAATPPAVAPATGQGPGPVADSSRTPVVVTAEDEVRAAPGWTLDDVEPIRVRVAGNDPTPPGERIAQVSRDGEVRYVVVNGHGTGAELIAVEGVRPPSMLAAILTYVSQGYTVGDGVR